jgi:hypothetical protein
MAFQDHRRKTKEGSADPEWISDHSFWWGWDPVRLNDVFVDRAMDIAVGRLEPFDKTWITGYPVFKDPLKMRPGTSLCKLGFPFVSVTATFSEDTNSFRIADGCIPVPLFPMEGMHTRNISQGKSPDGIDILYVETSSPGLRGQSGGPIFDSNGNICAIQLRMNHMPLDFAAEAVIGEKKVVENQFINLGIGLHVKTITDILRKRNIRFSAEGDTEYKIIS